MTGAAFRALLLAPLLSCARTATAPAPPDLAGVEPAVARAIEAAEDAVRTTPGATSGEAWGRLGLVLDAHGFTPEASTAYARAAELASADARWPALRAGALPPSDPARRLAALARAAQLLPEGSPESAALWLQRGLAELDLVQADDAARSLERSLAARETPEALTALARALRARGDDPGARGALERAAALAPPYRPALVLLAETAERAGEQERARDLATQARALPDPPAPPSPFRDLVEAAGVSALHHAVRGSRALAAGDAAGAIPELQAAVAARPDLPAVRLELGQALVLAGRGDEGVAVLREAARREPRDPAAKRSLAAALAATGALEESVALSREVLLSVPEDAELRAHAADLLVALGRPEDAVRLLEQGLARGGAPAALRRRLALLLATRPEPALRDGPRALALAEELCAARADAADLEALACARAACADFPGALEALARADRGEGDAGRLALHRTWRTLFTAGRAVGEGGAESR